MAKMQRLRTVNIQYFSFKWTQKILPHFTNQFQLGVKKTKKQKQRKQTTKRENSTLIKDQKFDHSQD